MKKLILITATIILLSGCGAEIKNPTVTYIEINAYLQGISQARYETDGGYWGCDYFYDSIGKYKIGDRIKLVKK